MILESVLYQLKKLAIGLAIAGGLVIAVGQSCACAGPGVVMPTPEVTTEVTPEAVEPTRVGATWNPVTQAALREVGGLLATGAETSLDETAIITVHDLSADGVYGRADWAGGRFVIELHDDLSMEMALDTLIHEWAHLMAWGTHQDDHGPYWGVAYAAAYRRSRGGP